ncbi:hypothetical protein MMC28_002458 [Mycoblastus sanguinarius]|nr:hypothetical protein [Mycoblastus sanguinarius]
MSSVNHVQPHTARQSPPHVRKTAMKATRSTPSSKSAGTPKITIKGAKQAKQAKEDDEVASEDDDDDDMESSFLQFCAMCEKQIVVPNSSILYCSESCRRRDATQTYPTHPYLTLASPTKMTASAHLEDPFGSKIPTYVPAMQPTPRSSINPRIPPIIHDGKSDLDPTEWKPAEAKDKQGESPGPKTVESPGSKSSGEWKPKLPQRPSSEAFQYLSRFHRSSDSLSSRRRPVLTPGRSTFTSRTTPSLSHTPTASTSSEESLTRTPYEYVAPPALSIPTTTITRGFEGISTGKDVNDLSYEKKLVGASLGSATGSLKKLLGSATDGM